MYEKDHNNDQAFYKEVQKCQGKSSCKITYNKNWFKESALELVQGTNGKDKHKLYFKYHCTDVYLMYFGQRVSKTDLNNVVVVINILIILMFILYLISWSCYERSIFAFFRQNNPQPTDYTIKLKNLPQDMSEEQLKQTIYDHLNEFKNKLMIRSDCIIDINVTKNNNLLYMDQLISTYDIKITNYFDKMITEGIINKPEGQQVDLKYVLEQIALYPECIHDKRKKKIYQKMMKTIKQKGKYQHQRLRIMNKKQKFQSVFVTFNTNANKTKYFNSMNISSGKRFQLHFAPTKGHINYLKGEVLSVKNPSQPNSIIWENVQVTPGEKFFRRLISYICTIVLIAIPIAVVVVISSNITDTEPLKLSCPNSDKFTDSYISANPSVMQALVADYKESKARNLLFCYCYQDIRGRLYK